MDFDEAWPDTISSVGKACACDDVPLLQSLLSAGRPVDVGDNRGWKPIHEAAAKNRTACMHILLNEGNSNKNWTTFIGETSLFLSIKNGHEEMARLLLDSGADPNICNHKEESPLHFATKKRMRKTVKRLIKSGASINAVDYGGETALHIATENDDMKMLITLLNNSAAIDVVDHLGRTPIFMAAHRGHLETLRLLLKSVSAEKLKSVIEMCPDDKTTPLMIAAQSGSFECIRLLMDYKANVNHVANDRLTALHLAIYGGHMDCVQILFDAMDPSMRDEKCTKSYKCLFHIALSAKRFGFELMGFLLDKGINVNNCVIPWWMSDMMVAGSLPFKNCEFLTKMLKYHRCCKFKWLHLSILSCAIFYRDFELVEAIIKRGSEINPTIPYVVHPLVIAIVTEQHDVIDLLLENGAKTNHPLSFNDSLCPFVLQVASTSPDILIKFMKHGADIETCFHRLTKCCEVIYFKDQAHFSCLNKIAKSLVLRDYDSYRCKFFEDSSTLKKLASDHECWDDRICDNSLRNRCRRAILTRICRYRERNVCRESLDKLKLPKMIIDYLFYEDL